MYLINIFPLGNLSMEYQQKMHMYLTHMVEKYPVYVEVAKNAPGYKILDNSLIELGGAVSVDRVIAAAETIGADEIILPDVFQDGEATIEAVKEALDTIHEKYKYAHVPFKLMAVAQGKDLEDWYNCYQFLKKTPEIDVIGLPKVLAKMHPKGRPGVVEELCNVGSKPHHLLGLWYSLSEFVDYRPGTLRLLRSCDTVQLAYLAKYGLNSAAVRPDGFTVNLEKDTVDYSNIDSNNFKTALNQVRMMNNDD